MLASLLIIALNGWTATSSDEVAPPVIPPDTDSPVNVVKPPKRLSSATALAPGVYFREDDGPLVPGRF